MGHVGLAICVSRQVFNDGCVSAAARHTGSVVSDLGKIYPKCEKSVTLKSGFNILFRLIEISVNFERTEFAPMFVPSWPYLCPDLTALLGVYLYWPTSHTYCCFYCCWYLEPALRPCQALSPCPANRGVTFCLIDFAQKDNKIPAIFLLHIAYIYIGR